MTTNYGIRDQLSCFDIFTRHILFDETAYALSSRSRLGVLSNVLFDVPTCGAYDATTLGLPLTLENRDTRLEVIIVPGPIELDFDCI